jgi:hypothetical protein
VSAFLQNGVTLMGECPAEFNRPNCQFGTMVPGIGLTVSGAVLMGVGAGLIAWPPAKAKPQVALFGSAGGLSVGVRY